MAAGESSRPSPPDMPGKQDVQPREMMLIALSREIVKSVKSRGHKLVLAGAGARDGGLPCLLQFGPACV